MIEIKIDKLYKYDRPSEPCFIGIPLPKGQLKSLDKVAVYQEDKRLPLQSKVTSSYDDGSVRFLFLRFLADIPANKGLTLRCELEDNLASDVAELNKVAMSQEEDGFTVNTVCDDTKKPFSFRVKNGSEHIFDNICYGDETLSERQFQGPSLTTKEGLSYDITLGDWEVVEQGPVCTILKAKGYHRAPEAKHDPQFEVKLTAYAGKSWVEVSYRLINTTDVAISIDTLKFDVITGSDASCDPDSEPVNRVNDNACCADTPLVFHVSNSQEADQLSEQIPLESVRTLTASSNYKTAYTIGQNGSPVKREVYAEMLLKEANEHFAEVFYGTFFADRTDERFGIAATIFQAQQNCPKAISASQNGISIMLVPKDLGQVSLLSGMSREQKFLLHFHPSDMAISQINSRSIIYQMPDRPYVAPSVHEASGVWPDIFPKKVNPKVEYNLMGRADAHSRAYGMLNFGDSYDANYTSQGRGGGKLVWVNNEYDFPHACALLYARTGIRRFLDYNIAACSHWMDVDICHYHQDPSFIGGQWEHTAGHTIDGVIVCSHEWVEGLLDYYHFTGDERGLETALGIGRNVNYLLGTPMYAVAGESSARETGWALRTLTALYVETHDKTWLTRCDKILNDFKTWEQQYGHWLSPYTDNTVIRVGFMISIAIGSLMRYYKVFPDPEVKDMIIRAVDDLIENCYMENLGIFYYKELPSLSRAGTNTLLLEALTAAYDLTGDSHYLDYGIGTYENAISDKQAYSGSNKKILEDTVIVGTVSSKAFAQSMIPIAGFYRALSEQ